MPKNTGFKCQCVLRSWSNRVVEWLGGFANVIIPFFMSLIKLCWQNKKCRTQPQEHSADRQALFWKSSSKKKKKQVFWHILESVSFGFSALHHPENSLCSLSVGPNSGTYKQDQLATSLSSTSQKLPGNSGRFRKNNFNPSLFDFWKTCIWSVLNNNDFTGADATTERLF